MVLVDANVLLDVVTRDAAWLEWSKGQLERLESRGIAINPIIFAELAPAFRTEQELQTAFRDWPVAPAGAALRSRVGCGARIRGIPAARRYAHSPFA